MGAWESLSSNGSCRPAADRRPFARGTSPPSSVRFQHGQSSSTAVLVDFELDFGRCGVPAASAGSTATAAPSNASEGEKQKRAQSHREPTFLVLDVPMAVAGCRAWRSDIPARYPLRTPARKDPSRSVFLERPCAPLGCAVADGRSPPLASPFHAGRKARGGIQRSSVCYLTVRVPSIPAMRCPGTEQKNL